MDSYAIDPVTDLAALVSDEFPGAAQSTYLSSCTRGLLPRSARRAVDGWRVDTSGPVSGWPRIGAHEDTRFFGILLGLDIEL